MFSYLEPADRAVVDGLEEFEIVMAKDQAEYNPLRCLAGNIDQGPRLSRWTLTAEQREAIGNGADVFLELWTFNQPMNPIRVGVGKDLNPDFWREMYALPETTAEKAQGGHGENPGAD